MTAVGAAAHGSLGKIVAVTIVIAHDTAQHIACGADHAGVDAVLHQRVRCLGALVLPADAAHVLCAADCAAVGAAAHRAAVHSGNTRRVLTAGDLHQRGAVFDGARVFCRDGGGVVIADDLTADGKIFDGAGVLGNQCGSAGRLAIESADGMTAAVQLSGESRDGCPVPVVQVNIGGQLTLDPRGGLCRIGKPLQLRRRGDLIHTADLLGFGSFAVPAGFLDGRLVGVSLRCAAGLPFQDGIAAVDGSGVRREFVSKLRRGQRL